MSFSPNGTYFDIGSGYISLEDVIAITGGSGSVGFTFPTYVTKPEPDTGTPPQPPQPPPQPPQPPPPPPQPPPPPPTKYTTVFLENYIPFNNSDLDLCNAISDTFFYTPQTIVYPTIVNNRGGLSNYIDGTPANELAHATSMYGNSDRLRINVIEAKLSPLNTDVLFNLFKNISEDRNQIVSIEGYILEDILTTTTTKILYPFSVYLKSIDVVYDAYNANGYTQVALLNNIIDSKVYSVNVEGAPTSCETGYSVAMQQILNNCYYPNMKLSFNFVDYSGVEFSYICDDPLVKIDTDTAFHTDPLVCGNGLTGEEYNGHYPGGYTVVSNVDEDWYEYKYGKPYVPGLHDYNWFNQSNYSFCFTRVVSKYTIEEVPYNYLSNLIEGDAMPDYLMNIAYAHHYHART